VRDSGGTVASVRLSKYLTFAARLHYARGERERVNGYVTITRLTTWAEANGGKKKGEERN